MTKQIDILSTQTSDTKNFKSSSSSSNKDVKQEASLFDKLLNGKISNSENKDESSSEKSKFDSTTPTNIKKTDVDLNSKDKIEKNTLNESDNKNILTPNKSMSLLDRLVLEAKKSNTTTSNTSLDNTKAKEVPHSDEKITQSNNKTKTNDTKNITAENTKSIVVPEVIQSDEKITQSNNKNEVTLVKEEIKTESKTNEIKTLNLDTTKNIITENKKNPVISEEIQSGEKVAIKNQEVNENTNSKLAKDLALLDTNSSKNEKINITKEEIEALEPKQKQEPKSLMDSLLEKTKNVKNQTLISEESKILKNTDNINYTNKAIDSKSVISNIYLSSQQNNINNNALSNKVEIINTVKDATTVKEIEVNANKLDLNVKEISLESKKNEIKKDTITLIDRSSSLDKLILNKNARHNELSNLITKSVEASNTIFNDSTDIDSEVSLNVNTTLAQNIETRIIGARQKMESMMSDVARKMYENYKPPVTAFRINLNPLSLGNIAITMKSTKDNGINISLNISNTATLDAFVDSQSSLRNALNKTFEDGSSFNLDFSSNDQNNNKSNNQENSNNSFTNKSDTQTILESREKNLESEDRNLDYM